MKKIIITGVTSGIGRALMLRFNQEGHYVIGIARNKEKLNGLRTELLGSFELIEADLGKTQDIIKAATYIKSKHQAIDVLINNAAMVPGHLMMSDEGHEMQFQVNHLAVVSMTHQLLPLLIQTKGIIITTASDAHRPARYHASHLERLQKYSLMASYSETKLYNILFTKGFNAHVANQTNVKAFAVHPGLVNTDLGGKETQGFMQKVWRFMARRGIRPEQATQTYADIINGLIVDDYVSKSQPIKASKTASNVENMQDLWKKTNEILNIEWV